MIELEYLYDENEEQQVIMSIDIEIESVNKELSLLSSCRMNDDETAVGGKQVVVVEPMDDSGEFFVDIEMDNNYLFNLTPLRPPHSIKSPSSAQDYFYYYYIFNQDDYDDDQVIQNNSNNNEPRMQHTSQVILNDLFGVFGATRLLGDDSLEELGDIDYVANDFSSFGVNNTSTPTDDIMIIKTRDDYKQRFNLNDLVSINERRRGRVKYEGRVHFADGYFCGIELTDGEGKHDGKIDDVRYFQCKPNHGLFVPIDKVKLAKSKPSHHHYHRRRRQDIQVNFQPILDQTFDIDDAKSTSKVKQLRHLSSAKKKSRMISSNKLSTATGSLLAPKSLNRASLPATSQIPNIRLGTNIQSKISRFNDTNNNSITTETDQQITEPITDQIKKSKLKPPTSIKYPVSTTSSAAAVSSSTSSNNVLVAIRNQTGNSEASSLSSSVENNNNIKLKAENNVVSMPAVKSKLASLFHSNHQPTSIPASSSSSSTSISPERVKSCQTGQVKRLSNAFMNNINTQQPVSKLAKPSQASNIPSFGSTPPAAATTHHVSRQSSMLGRLGAPSTIKNNSPAISDNNDSPMPKLSENPFIANNSTTNSTTSAAFSPSSRLHQNNKLPIYSSSNNNNKLKYSSPLRVDNCCSPRLNNKSSQLVDPAVNQMNVEDPPDHRQHDVIDSPVFIKTISNNDSCLSDYLLENELIPDDLIVDDPDSSVVSQQQLADETPNKEIQVNEIVNELVDQVASIKQQETTTTATDQSNQFFIDSNIAKPEEDEFSSSSSSSARNSSDTEDISSSLSITNPTTTTANTIQDDLNKTFDKLDESDNDAEENSLNNLVFASESTASDERTLVVAGERQNETEVYVTMNSVKLNSSSSTNMKSVESATKPLTNNKKPVTLKKPMATKPQTAPQPPSVVPAVSQPVKKLASSVNQQQAVKPLAAKKINKPVLGSSPAGSTTNEHTSSIQPPSKLGVVSSRSSTSSLSAFKSPPPSSSTTEQSNVLNTPKNNKTISRLAALNGSKSVISAKKSTVNNNKENQIIQDPSMPKSIAFNKIYKSRDGLTAVSSNTSIMSEVSNISKSSQVSCSITKQPQAATVTSTPSTKQVASSVVKPKTMIPPPTPLSDQRKASLQSDSKASLLKKPGTLKQSVKLAEAAVPNTNNVEVAKSSSPTNSTSSLVAASKSEIKRLEALCESRTKELTLLRMELKQTLVSFDAISLAFNYVANNLNGFEAVQLRKQLASNQKKHDEEVKRLNSVIGSKEEELIETGNELTRVRNDSLKKVTELEAKLVELDQEHKIQIQYKDAEHDLIIKDLNKEKEQTIKNHAKLVEKMKIDYEKQVGELSEQLAAKITENNELELRVKECEEALAKDKDERIQRLLDIQHNLEKEIESLKAAIDIKNSDLFELRAKNNELTTKVDNYNEVNMKLRRYKQEAEQLGAILKNKQESERRVSENNRLLALKVEAKQKENQRLSMEMEQLQFRLHSQSNLSLNTTNNNQNDSMSFMGSPNVSMVVMESNIGNDSMISSPQIDSNTENIRMRNQKTKLTRASTLISQSYDLDLTDDTSSHSLLLNTDKDQTRLRSKSLRTPIMSKSKKETVGDESESSKMMMTTSYHQPSSSTATSSTSSNCSFTTSTNNTNRTHHTQFRPVSEHFGDLNMADNRDIYMTRSVIVYNSGPESSSSSSSSGGATKTDYDLYDGGAAMLSESQTNLDDESRQDTASMVVNDASIIVLD